MSPAVSTIYAALAEELDHHPEETIPLSEPRFSSRVVREPLGVVGAITPWNYPLLMVSWKVAPALAAGCTMVLKPSELTPLTALELGVIAEEVGLPAGVLNIVTGTGMQAGEPLTEHPLVDKLAFTGSVSTGRKVMMAGAQDIKTVSLELGGKSPFVIFADSDIEKAVEWIMFGIFWNQGQVCSATSRVLVEAGIYDAVVSRLCEEAAKIKIGNGMEDGTLLGPIVSKGQYDKIVSAIDRARIDGADGRLWRRPSGRSRQRLFPGTDGADRHERGQLCLEGGDFRSGRLRQAVQGRGRCHPHGQ